MQFENYNDNCYTMQGINLIDYFFYIINHLNVKYNVSTNKI